LVTTPAFRHWYHSCNDHIKHNYASTLPFLDWLFGSYYLPRHWLLEVGAGTLLAEALGG
jgi:sterol desaturase/sphingolipid hydroxylase (fatty acid hydroxylase superfamily)